IRQILLNLVGNAVKFTEVGRVALTVRQGAGWAEIAVADTGIGVDPGVLPHIFDEFRQADGSTTRRFGGTGLGLAIARKLARLQGGDAPAASVAGAGSRFTLFLPLRGSTVAELPSKNADSEPAEDEVFAAPSGATELLPIVLVVENDERARALAMRAIGRVGAQVVSVRSGVAAFRAFEVVNPSLVLLDISLAGPIDGWQVLHGMRARVDLREIRVAVFSVVNEPRLAAQLGATVCLQKPVERGTLEATIRRYVSG